MRNRPSIWVLATVAVTGCATTRAARDGDSTDGEPITLGLFPIVWETPPPLPALDLAEWVERAFIEGGRFDISDVADLDGDNVADTAATCFAEFECLTRVGHRIGVEKVALIRAGALGQTLVLRLLVADVARGAQEKAVQEVVQPVNPEAIQAGAERLVAAVSPPPVPAVWYEQWWVWTAVAATVVAAATVIYVVATPGGGESQEPDIIIDPP